MKLKYVINIFTLLLLGNAYGQDLNIANKYTTPGILNPALVGIANRPIAGVTDNYYRYWDFFGMNSNPSINVMNAGFEINPSSNAGLGLYINQVNYSTFIKRTSVLFSLSGKTTFGENICVRTGTRIGFSGAKIDPYGGYYDKTPRWLYFQKETSIGFGIFMNYKDIYLQAATPSVVESVLKNNIPINTYYSSEINSIKSTNLFMSVGGFIKLSKTKDRLLHISALNYWGGEFRTKSNIRIDYMHGPWMFGINDFYDALRYYDYTDLPPERLYYSLSAGYNSNNYRVSLNYLNNYGRQFGISFCWKFKKRGEKENDKFEEKFNRLF